MSLRKRLPAPLRLGGVTPAPDSGAPVPGPAPAPPVSVADGVITPGKVIYQNELMQLIQYAPLTQEVNRRPLLIIPPWINKFYILDMRQNNSFVRWAVEQGHTVFVVSSAALILTRIAPGDFGVWTILQGHLTLELFGHFKWLDTDLDTVFDEHVRAMLLTMGFDPAALAR